MAKRRRLPAKPPLPAADTKHPSPAPDLFRGHDPAEVEERLIEVFSGMPCDLGSDDMAPPTQDELEEIFEDEGEAGVEKALAEWREYARFYGRSDGDLIFNRTADRPMSTGAEASSSAATPGSKADAPTAEPSPTTKLRDRVHDTTAQNEGKAYVILGGRPSVSKTDKK